MFGLLENALSRYRTSRADYRRTARRRPQPRRFEALEPRHLLAANIVLSPVSQDVSFADVGLTNNVAGEFRAVVDGKIDKVAGNYTAEIDWGDGSGFQPGKVILKGQASIAPFQVKGSHVYDEIGNYTVTVRVSGNGVTVTKDTGIRTVRQMPSGLPGTRPPVSESGGKQVELQVGSISTQHTCAGVGFELNNLATLQGFLNGQVNKTLSDYKAYVNWGDSSSWTEASLAPKLNSSYSFLIKGSHVYEQAGNYRVVVDAVGPDGTSVSADTTTVVVDNMPGGFKGTQPGLSAGHSAPADVGMNLYPENVINAYAGVQLVEYAVGEFNGYVNGKKETASALLNYRAQINWGDSGEWTTGTIVANDNRSSVQFQILGTHTYERVGTYQVVVYLNGPDGTSASANTTMAIVAKPAAPVLTGSVTQATVEGEQVPGPLATFDSDDINTPPSRLRATVTWGDGTPAQNAPIRLRSGTTYEVVPPEKTYDKPGTYRATVVVDDGRGNSSQFEKTIHVTPGEIDLVASVKTNRVVPTNAKDLNLNFLFGNEKLTVPVVVSNAGGKAASGMVQISVYLAKTRSIDNNSVLLGMKNVSVSLAGGGKRTVVVNGKVAANLKIGQKYFLVARVTSSTIRETNTANNTAGSGRRFEFLGTPTSNPKVFTNGTFFRFVRNTLQARPNIPANVDRGDPRSFIAHFEGAKRFAYLDSENISTIGIGINLNTVNGGLKADLADAVRRFYQSTYNKKLSLNDTAIINMLKREAHTKANETAISQRDMNLLFNRALAAHEKIARDALGDEVYRSLTQHQRVTVVSMAFNLGDLKKFPLMVLAIKSNRPLRAAFNIVDAKRTTQEKGLIRRTGVEFANFFFGQEHLLGRLISK